MQEVAQWGQLAPQVMQTSSRQDLNKNIFTHLLKAKEIYI